MSLDPESGETPLPFEEVDMLLPKTRESLGEPISRASVHDLEQLAKNEVRTKRLTSTFGGELALDIASTILARQGSQRGARFPWIADPPELYLAAAPSNGTNTP